MITTASNLDFAGAPFSKTNFPNIWRKDMIDIGKMGVEVITEQNLNYAGISSQRIFDNTADKSNQNYHFLGVIIN